MFANLPSQPFTPPSRSHVLRGNAHPDALRPRDAERLARAFHAERGTRGVNAYLPSLNLQPLFRLIPHGRKFFHKIVSKNRIMHNEDIFVIAVVGVAAEIEGT